MTAAADIYSLGITGIELLTGRRVASSIKTAVAPQRFQRLLGQMIASDASQRPTAFTVVNNLTEILNTDDVEQNLQQNNDGLLAGLLLGGVLALGGIAATVAALAIDAENKGKHYR